MGLRIAIPVTVQVPVYMARVSMTSQGWIVSSQKFSFKIGLLVYVMLPVPIPMAMGKYDSEEEWGLIGGGEVDFGKYWIRWKYGYLYT